MIGMIYTDHFGSIFRKLTIFFEKQSAHSNQLSAGSSNQLSSRACRGISQFKLKSTKPKKQGERKKGDRGMPYVSLNLLQGFKLF